MAADRTNSQKLVTLHADAELYRAMETSRGRVNRSQWIREAILEKLKAEGFRLNDEVALPPDRTGKGGRPPKKVNYKDALKGQKKS